MSAPLSIMLALLLLLPSVALCDSIPVVVNTSDCGPVQGTVSSGVQSFVGIPYASAPARWSESRPLPELESCWSGTLVSRAPPACIQMSSSSRSQAEDCLTLSVFSPPGTAGPFPVLVFFHGGDLTEGAAPDFAQAVELFSGEGLPVIMVSAQYRLNVFGFLSVTALAGAAQGTDSTGMYGIRDQQQALAWVQRNIVGFGGDRSKVTVFGQSSGGTSVMALLGSSASKGLFSRAMSLSGSPNMSMPLARQQAQHESIVAQVGCAGSADPSERLGCLRNASPEALVAAIPQGPDHGAGTAAHPSWTQDNIFGIVSAPDGARQPGIVAVDGNTLREPLLEALAGGAGVDVPFIGSTMAQEAGLSPRAQVGNLSAAEFSRFLSEQFDSGWGKGFGERVAALYQDEIAEDRQKAYLSMAADQGVLCGNQAVARAAAAGSLSRVYSLYFEARADEHKWAYHSYDLELAAKHNSSVAIKLRALWYEFADTGAVAAWTPVQRSAASGLSTTAIRFLADGTTMAAPSWRAEFCEFWSANGFGSEFWWSN